MSNCSHCFSQSVRNQLTIICQPILHTKPFSSNKARLYPIAELHSTYIGECAFTHTSPRPTQKSTRPHNIYHDTGHSLSLTEHTNSLRKTQYIPTGHGPKSGKMSNTCVQKLIFRNTACFGFFKYCDLLFKFHVVHF